MHVNFKSPVTFGQPVDMVANWGTSTARKIVTWYRYINDITTPIWIYEGNSSTTLRNRAIVMSEHQIMAVPQDNFTSFHTIRILKVTEHDNGMYWCVLKLQGSQLRFTSIAKGFEVTGKCFTTSEDHNHLHNYNRMLFHNKYINAFE